jgi:hypothetical protein
MARRESPHRLKRKNARGRRAETAEMAETCRLIAISR